MSYMFGMKPRALPAFVTHGLTADMSVPLRLTPAPATPERVPSDTSAKILSSPAFKRADSQQRERILLDALHRECERTHRCMALNAEQSKLIIVLQQNLSDANVRVTHEHESAVQQAALIASLQERLHNVEHHELRVQKDQTDSQLLDLQSTVADLTKRLQELDSDRSRLQTNSSADLAALHRHCDQQTQRIDRLLLERASLLQDLHSVCNGRSLDHTSTSTAVTKTATAAHVVDSQPAAISLARRTLHHQFSQMDIQRRCLLSALDLQTKALKSLDRTPVQSLNSPQRFSLASSVASILSATSEHHSTHFTPQRSSSPPPRTDTDASLERARQTSAAAQLELQNAARAVDEQMNSLQISLREFDSATLSYASHSSHSTALPVHVTVSSPATNLVSLPHQDASGLPAVRSELALQQRRHRVKSALNRVQTFFFVRLSKIRTRRAWLSAAFTQWRLHAQSIHQRINQLKLCVRQSHALHLRRGLQKWRNFVFVQCRSEHSLTMQKQQLVWNSYQHSERVVRLQRAFALWRQFMDSQLRRRRKLQAVVRRQPGIRLRAALSRWYSLTNRLHLLEVNASNAVITKRIDADARTRLLGARLKLIQMSKSHTLRQIFQQWKQNVDLWRLQRSISLKWRQNNAVRHSFEKWRIACNFRLNRRRNLQNALSILEKVGHQALSSAFMRWQRFIATSSMAKQTETRAKLLHMVVRRMQRDKIAQVLRSWRQVCQYQNLRRNALQLWFSRSEQRSIAAAFHRLHCHSVRESNAVERSNSIEQHRALILARQHQACELLLAHSTDGQRRVAIMRWFRTVQKRKQLRLATQISQREQSERRLRHAFSAWHRLQQTLVAHRERLSILDRAADLFARHNARVRVFASFTSWSRLTTAMTHRTHMLRLVSHMRERRAVRSAWDHLRLLYHNMQQRRLIVAQRQAVVETQMSTSRLLVGRCLRRLLFGRMKVAFDRWRDEISVLSRRRRLVAAVLRRAKNYRTRTAFHRWCGFVRHSVSAEHKQLAIRLEHSNNSFLERLFRKHDTGLTRATFIAWRTYVQNTQRRRRELSIKFGLSARGVLINTFRKWKQIVMFSRVRMNVVRHMCRRRDLARLSSAMLAWSEHASESVRGRKVMQRVLSRLCRLQMWTAWRHWCTVTVASRVTSEQNVLTLQTQRRYMQRAMARLVHRDLSRAFNRWAAMTRAAQTDSQLSTARDRLLAFASHRMHRTLLGSVMRAWRQTAVQGRLRVVALRLWFQRMRFRQIGAAFHRLRCVAVAHRAGKAVTAQAQNQQALIAAETMLNVSTRGRMRVCIARWMRAVRRRRSLTDRAEALTESLRHRQLTRCFSQWNRAFNSSKAQNQRLASLEQVAALSAHHRQRVQIFTSFTAWLRLTTELTQRQRVLQFAESMRHRRTLRSNWESWRAAFFALQRAREQKQQIVDTKLSTGRLLVGRALRRLMFGRLQQAFDRWRDIISVSSHRRRLVATVLRRAKNCRTRVAFHRWCAFAQASRLASSQARELKAYRIKLRMQVVFASAADRVRSAFAQWRLFVIRRQDTRFHLQRFIQLRCRGMKSAAFNRIASFGTKHQNMTSSRQISAYMMFVAWRAHVALQRRLQIQAVAKPFFAWRAAMSRRTLQRSRAMRLIVEWALNTRSNLLRRALSQWRASCMSMAHSDLAHTLVQTEHRLNIYRDSLVIMQNSQPSTPISAPAAASATPVNAADNLRLSLSSTPLASKSLASPGIFANNTANIQQLTTPAVVDTSISSPQRTQLSSLWQSPLQAPPQLPVELQHQYRPPPFSLSPMPAAQSPSPVVVDSQSNTSASIKQLHTRRQPSLALSHAAASSSSFSTAAAASAAAAMREIQSLSAEIAQRSAHAAVVTSTLNTMSSASSFSHRSTHTIPSTATHSVPVSQRLADLQTKMSMLSKSIANEGARPPLRVDFDLVQHSTGPMSPSDLRSPAATK